jgi:hypothetical protein
MWDYKVMYDLVCMQQACFSEGVAELSVVRIILVYIKLLTLSFYQCSESIHNMKIDPIKKLPIFENLG